MTGLGRYMLTRRKARDGRPARRARFLAASLNRSMQTAVAELMRPYVAAFNNMAAVLEKGVHHRES